MSASVETMFSVRVTPWHGLGTIVKEAPTSAEAIKLAGLDWRVLQEPVFLPDQTVVPGYKANVRETDRAVLGLVTDRYRVVQNEEAFAFCDALLGEGVKFETAGSLSGGKRNFILAILPEQYKILGDDVDPYVVFTNSHDGKGSITAAMTPIRVVCQNTLNLALREAKRSWSTYHTGDVQGKLDEAQAVLRLGEQYMKSLNDESEKLAKVKLADDKIKDYIKMLLPVDDDASERTKQNTYQLQYILFSRYFDTPDLQGLGKNAYRFINAVSDFATHKEPMRRMKNYRENLFARTIDGNAMIDRAYEMMREVV